MQALFHRDSLTCFKKVISSFIVLTFLTSLVVAPAGAQILPIINVPQSATNAFHPPILLGLKIHPENPLLFDFIVDQGQSKLSTDELKEETTKLVKYFLAALTIPDKEVWVNLSPTEKDRIIPDVLGQTTMGKTMLEQDYLLKQLASSLTNPETDLGKKYWDNVGNRHACSLQNKVWIMPAKAEVLESNGIVLVGEKRLKVMLDEEYGTQALSSPHALSGDPLSEIDSRFRGNDKASGNEMKKLSTQVFRELILPKIVEEVNTGKDFVEVRQIYNSVILAAWYKKALKESLLGKIYTDKGKVAGVETDDKQMKQRIYEQYLAAFKKGAYNLIKEEADENGDLIPRKYFSGGAALNASSVLVTKDGPVAEREIERTLSGSSQIITATTELDPDPRKLKKLSNASSGLGQDSSSKVWYYRQRYPRDAVINILEELVNYWDRQENNPDKFSTDNVPGKIITSVQLLDVPDKSFSLDEVRYRSALLDHIIKELKLQNPTTLGWMTDFHFWVSQDFRLNFAFSNVSRGRSIDADQPSLGFFKKLLPIIKQELEKYSDNSDSRQDYWKGVSERTSVLLAGPPNKIKTVLKANYSKFHQEGNFYDLKAILSDPSRVRLQESFSNIQNIIAEVLGDREGFELQKVALAGQQVYPQTENAAYVNGSFIHTTLVSDILSNWKKNVPFREKLVPEISMLERPLIEVIGVHLMPDLSIAFELREVDLNVLKTVKQTAAQLAKDDGQAPRFFPDTFAATIAYLYGENISRKQLFALNRRLNQINEQLKQHPLSFFINELQLQIGRKNGFVVTASRTLKFSASSPVNDKVNIASAPVDDPQVGGIDFDPTNMNLQIKRDGRGVPLPLPEQNLEQINIQGLFPVIINITPINAQTLPIFLGQVPKEPAKEIEQVAGT